MKNISVKNSLIFLVIILFVLSSVLPVVFGTKSKSMGENIELKNLAIICREPDSFNNVKYEYYKQQLIRQRSSEDNYNGDVVEPEDTINQIESKITPLSFGPIDSAWPMKCHDLHHTSQSTYSTANNPYIEKWRFYFSDWLEDTPVIDNDGTIYCKGGYNILDHLYAINPDGTEKWKYKTDGLILGSSPAIAEDGTIYVGSWDDYLYAICPNGTRKWRFCAHDDISSSPAIAEDGTIYFGTMLSGNNIYAVNPDGTEKWHYTTGYAITSDPAIGDDDTIYIGSGDHYLYALYPNGTLHWRFKTGDYIKGPPSIAEDGTVYIGSWDDYLYALYPNGTMKWKCKIGQGTETNPSIGDDGNIYVGSYDGHLYAVYPNGTMKWSFMVIGNIHQSSPAISADGTVYFGTDDSGYIYAVNPDGTERWRKKIADEWVESSPVIAEDGTVYIGSSCSQGRGYLHAFGGIESNSPPSAPSINGPSEVKVGEKHWFTFYAVDPDRNPIQLYVDWGDGNSGWVGEYASEEEIWQEHSWSTQGGFTVKAKVKDVMGEESGWGYLEVTVPKNKIISNNQLIQNMLQQSQGSLLLRILRVIAQPLMI